jgi:hypothetical protein
MKRFAHFFLYNNTIPLVFGVLFLGAGATFAASPEARQSVVSSETKTIQEDNTYLLNTTITDATVGITIGSVTEDTDAYYIDYQLSTLGSKDGVWQPITAPKSLKVEKDSVVSRDLGLYAEEELKEVHDAEVRNLLDAQDRARSAGLSHKVVATEYNGLVGQFFDPKKEVFPDYDPLIDPSVGIPLTTEQKKAHEVVRELVDKAQKDQEAAAQGSQTADNTDTNGQQSGGDGGASTGTGTGDSGTTTTSSVESPSTPAPSTSDPAPAPSVDSLFSPDTTRQ